MSLFTLVKKHFRQGGHRTLKPRAPGKDVASEKENVQHRQQTPPKVKKETHEMSISTSPIPIEEAALIDPYQPKEPEPPSNMWFPGAACVPQAPEKHEICIGTEEPSGGKAKLNLSKRLASQESGISKSDKSSEGQKPQMVNSYFAKLYLQKSLHDSRKT